MSEKKKERMPTGMYIGSAWIGFALLMFVCWVLSLNSANFYITQGEGNPRNFMLLLQLMAVFGFGLPMLIGLRMVRRAGQQSKTAEEERQEIGNRK